MTGGEPGPDLPERGWGAGVRRLLGADRDGLGYRADKNLKRAVRSHSFAHTKTSISGTHATLLTPSRNTTASQPGVPPRVVAAMHDVASLNPAPQQLEENPGIPVTQGARRGMRFHITRFSPFGDGVLTVR